MIKFNYMRNMKKKEGLIEALLFGSGAINLLTKVKDRINGIEHKKDIRLLISNKVTMFIKRWDKLFL